MKRLPEVNICIAELRNSPCCELSSNAIETLGSILNEERASEAIALHQQKGKSSKYIDTRVFKKIITTSTLRGATAFQNTKADMDRINALYRLKYLGKQYNYKVIQKEILEEQVRRAIAARIESLKFENMMESQEWPNEMKFHH